MLRGQLAGMPCARWPQLQRRDVVALQRCRHRELPAARAKFKQSGRAAELRGQARGLSRVIRMHGIAVSVYQAILKS